MKNIIIFLFFCTFFANIYAQRPEKSVPVSVSPEIIRQPPSIGYDIPPTVKDDPNPPSDDDIPYPPAEPEGLGPQEKPLRIIWGLHGLGGDKDS